MIHGLFGPRRPSRRLLYLLAWAPFVALGFGAVAASCLSYTPNPLGVDGRTIASADGGISAACVAQASTLVRSLGVTNQIELMHGQKSGCPMANLSNIFSTPGVPGQVDGMLFRDGPRGVCLAANLRQGASGYSTVFPAASSRAASFDFDLEETLGEDIGDEMVATGHTLILAPVINILRHPAWGRSQETYSEDSYVLGRMGTAFVLGAQKYVPACAKHFAANNIENSRQNDTSEMDEQTLHEIYGRHFEMVIQDGNVAAIMAAYNFLKLTDSTDPTGYKCTQNPELLTDMLRKTFGFQGIIMTDWWALPGDFAACSTTPARQAQYASEAVKAGLDLEMPWEDNFTQLQGLLSGNTINPSQVQQAAQYIVQTQCQFGILHGKGLHTGPTVTTQNPGNLDVENNEAHIQDSRKAATEGMVLLKNDGPTGPTLPIPPTVKTLAVVGATVPFHLAATDISNGTVDFTTGQVTGGGSPTYLTGDLGSSRVYGDPMKTVGPLAGITAAATPLGIHVVTGSDPASLAALNPPPDFYVVVAGLTPEDEGEDYTEASDRTSFSLDDKLIHREKLAAVQDPLIQTVAALKKPMVVVLEGGSVIDMPWLSSVPAVVMAWYIGEDGGDALADLLFGKKNFGGKLPVTWPNALTGTCTGACPQPASAACSGKPSCPCPSCFGDEPLFNVGASRTTPMDYYLGYRYYDHLGIKPLFPFGYGLSYTTFTYGPPALSQANAGKADTVRVTFPVTNAGQTTGDEVSLLFVSYPNTQRPKQLHSNVKELKGFVRTHDIMPGATAMVTIPLRVSDLKYWDTTHPPPSANAPRDGAWVVETGDIHVMVGGSSDKLSPPLTLHLQ